jgi:hypothetical protein
MPLFGGSMSFKEGALSYATFVAQPSEKTSSGHPGEYSFVRRAGLPRCGIMVSAKGEVRKRDGSKTAQAVANRCEFALCTRVGHCRRRIRVGTKLLPDTDYLLARVRLQRPREVPRSHHSQRAPPVFRFDKLPADNPYASQIEAIASDSSNGSLEDYLDASGTTAFLVIHDDKLLYERYFNGYDETSVNTSFSMAKSFASALVGIAIDEGHIKSVDVPITNYIPELLEKDKRFRSVTIRNLLTMSSGIKYEEGGDLPWSEEADDTKTYYATNLRKLALNSRIEGEPGEYFEYNNYNPLLVGLILERATKMPVARYME